MNAPQSAKFRDPSLVDFGGSTSGAGRRLELLGGVLVDRPLAHEGLPPRRTDHWSRAEAIFQGGPGPSGQWEFVVPPPEPWQVRLPVGSRIISLEVRPAPSGQVGVFLEQAEQWAWLAGTTPPGATMLSLFAHSGAATLALAAAGATVVHVDASRPSIAMARRNAAASGLADAAIRWVCEDARTFVARELRRGNRYDGVVLDPPSWGHGPKGQAFAIDRDLVPLMEEVGRLLASAEEAPAGPILLTCHSSGWHHRRLRDTLAGIVHQADRSRLESGLLHCTDSCGRRIELGDFARLPPLPRRS
jgi:23S rRNA (cytosine1962-C5)-methyltransferase